jgi:hypothetical protein
MNTKVAFAGDKADVTPIAWGLGASLRTGRNLTAALAWYLVPCPLLPYPRVHPSQRRERLIEGLFRGTFPLRAALQHSQFQQRARNLARQRAALVFEQPKALRGGRLAHRAQTIVRGGCVPSTQVNPREVHCRERCEQWVADLLGKPVGRFGERARGCELSAIGHEPGSQMHQNKIELGRALISHELLGGEAMPQAGLSIAARLGALSIDTLIVDRNEEIGDNWGNRYHSTSSRTGSKAMPTAWISTCG